MKFSFFHSWFLSSKYSESFFSGLASFLGTTMGTPESNKAESTPALPRDLTQRVFPRITLNYPSVWIKFLSFFIWIWGWGWLTVVKTVLSTMVAPVVACHEAHSSGLLAQTCHYGDLWLQLWPAADEQCCTVGTFQFTHQTTCMGHSGIWLL